MPRKLTSSFARVAMVAALLLAILPMFATLANPHGGARAAGGAGAQPGAAAASSAAGEASQPAPGAPDSARALPRPAEWIPGPGSWRFQEQAAIPGGAGSAASWRIVIETRPLGTIRGEERETAVALPRARIQRVSGRDTTTLAVLLPTGNAEVALLPPKSPEVQAVPSEMAEDELGRWPNACRLSIRDGSGGLDLDDDGNPEVLLSRFCTCAGFGCSSLALIELNPVKEGGPAILDPASLAYGVRLGKVLLQQVEANPEEPSRPTLDLAVDYLRDCRYIAEVGVTGEPDCGNCCQIPVRMRASSRGTYDPEFHRPIHQRLLDKVQEDLNYVASGDPEQPLRSEEKARIARAAAFFYLTGLGSATRTTIVSSLSKRTSQPDVQELLDRLEQFFLEPRPGDAGTETEGSAPR